MTLICINVNPHITRLSIWVATILHRVLNASHSFLRMPNGFATATSLRGPNPFLEGPSTWVTLVFFTASLDNYTGAIIYPNDSVLIWEKPWPSFWDLFR